MGISVKGRTATLIYDCRNDTTQLQLNRSMTGAKLDTTGKIHVSTLRTSRSIEEPFEVSHDTIYDFID